MSRDRGNLTWARRQWAGRTTRAVGREQGRCSRCNKQDKTGLIDGKCTACFVAGPLEPVGHLNGPVEELALAAAPTRHYRLIHPSGKVETGPVVLPNEQLMLTVLNLLYQSFWSQVDGISSEAHYAAFAVANAGDYAEPNPVASREEAALSGKPERPLFGPVLLVLRA
jgi:hypothetical protein